MKKNRIYLIGGGPGDPELLTLKAVRALSEADCVLYDQLINPEILRHCREDAEFVFVGKSKGDHTLPQDEINRLIVEKARVYEVVARVKGGDPLIFGRGGEEYEYAVANGFPCEIIPGITAASGASTSGLIPLTHREYSSEVVFMTGHKKKGDDYSSFASLNLYRKTHVIYMAVSAVADIMRQIMTNPGNETVPVAVIEKATRKNQRVLVSTVGSIAGIIEKERVQPPALLIVGEVVLFRERVMQMIGSEFDRDISGERSGPQ